MPTPNLNIAHVLVSQGQKHVTVNEGLDALDKATQGATAITIAGTYAVSAAELRGGFSLELTGTPGAAFNLDVPAIRRSFRVSNGTDGAATVQVTGGAGASVAVPVGEARFLYCDGADVIEEGGGGGSVTKATASDIRAGTADKYITADGIESAAEEVTLTDATTIAVDWSTFINANVTLGGNRTLGNPTAGEPGTSRLIRVIQDGTGSRTLAFGNQYKHPGGTAPTLSTAAGAVDVLEIYCVSANEFYVFSALGMA